MHRKAHGAVVKMIPWASWIILWSLVPGVTAADGEAEFAFNLFSDIAP
jgi:hypothetical protein